jgi:two-component system CheB/CheR fusion protein
MDGQHTHSAVEAVERVSLTSASLNTILDQTVIGIAQTDLSGRFAFANPRFCEIVGRSAESLETLRIQDALTEDCFDDLSWFDRRVADGLDWNQEMRCAQPDGSCRWVQISASLIKDRRGDPAGVIAFALDVSDRKQAEDKSGRLLDTERARHDELTEVNRHKNEFLALLGHELRNPLSAIASALQLLEQRRCDDSLTREMHSIIKRQSLHMCNLIAGLRDTSQIASGTISLDMRQVDLAQLVANAIADHRHAIDENHLLLVRELPGSPLWVTGDATRLLQVISNLLHNATKFTNRGGTITVMLVRRPSSAVLRVSDTGIGIDSSEMPAMFEPSRRPVSQRVRSKGGLGLGLPLVKRLVELHGGTITVTSDGLERGAEFSLCLPLTPTDTSNGYDQVGEHSH